MNPWRVPHRDPSGNKAAIPAAMNPAGLVIEPGRVRTFTGQDLDAGQAGVVINGRADAVEAGSGLHRVAGLLPQCS
jgi:hypothetical protein